MAVKTVTQTLTGLTSIQPLNTYYRPKNANARYLIKQGSDRNFKSKFPEFSRFPG